MPHMVIHDPLYGRFVAPPYLENLILTPEVRRLSQIRLVNTPSPSLASLGDIRRFSHTLGVLQLARHSRSTVYSDDEWRAFEASVLLHDVGTPPFAHLVEYHLREQSPAGWDHEAMIRDVLYGFHAPENRASQIFAGQPIRFARELKFSGISRALVESIITGKHPLSVLLFGSLDLDNLDNVARMAWALGLPSRRDTITELASYLSVNREHQLQLPESLGRHAVDEWARLRRYVYKILTFDPVAISAQAVLSEAIGLLISEGEMTTSDWFMTDEDLIAKLLQCPRTKDAVGRDYFGVLPKLAFLVQIKGTLRGLNLANRAAAKSLIERALSEAMPGERPLGYALIDRGTFSKRLRLSDPRSGIAWEHGTASESVILYGFLRSAGIQKTREYKCALDCLLSSLPVNESDIQEYKLGASREVDDAQRTFDFAPS